MKKAKNSGFRVKIEDISKIFKELKRPSPKSDFSSISGKPEFDSYVLGRAKLSPPFEAVRVNAVSSGEEISIEVFIDLGRYLDAKNKEHDLPANFPVEIFKQNFVVSLVGKDAAHVFESENDDEPKFIVLKRSWGQFYISAGKAGEESPPSIKLTTPDDLNKDILLLGRIIVALIHGVYSFYKTYINSEFFLEPNVILYLRGPVEGAERGADGGFPSVSGGNQAADKHEKSAQASIHKVNPDDIKETLDDVQGADVAKIEVMETIDFLKDPAKYEEMGAEMERGVLLSGPPGTGKTMLAKAVAKAAGVPFFTASGSGFVQVYVGTGAARVRALFEEARTSAPCIIFIDEVDALAKERTGGSGGASEYEHALSELLVQLSNYENKRIVVIAATNRPELIDPGIMRSGRLGKHVVMDLPDAAGREAILRVHAKNKRMETDVNLASLALSARRFSGSDLASLLNRAAILAVRGGRKTISPDNITEAKESILAGPARGSKLDFDEKISITHHELGHAIIATILYPDTDPVEFVTVEPRGTALGKVVTVPEKDTHSLFKHQIEAGIVELLGGRVAEEMFHGKERFSTGASSDLKYATDYARSMVTEWGMCKKSGLAVLGRKLGWQFLGGTSQSIDGCSEKSKCLIDDEVRKILNRCYKKAKKILKKNKRYLDEIAPILAERGKLNGVTFRRLLGKPLKNEKNEKQ